MLNTLYGAEWVEGAYFLQMLSVISFFYIQELIVRALLKTLNKTKPGYKEYIESTNAFIPWFPKK